MVWLVLAAGVYATPIDIPVDTSVEATATNTQETIVVKGKALTKKVFETLEDFRVRQLARFTVLKKEHSDVVAETTIKDITSMMNSESQTVSQETEVDTERSNEQTMEYVWYGYAWVGVEFFSRVALYYVVVILLALCIVRFVFSRFSR
jgi:hypothetical protein